MKHFGVIRSVFSEQQKRSIQNGTQRFLYHRGNRQKRTTYEDPCQVISWLEEVLKENYKS